MAKLKICKLCGKEFISKTNAQRYCNDTHYKQCAICGEMFEITWQTKNKECCSRKCTQQLRERTMLERHGVKYAQQNPEIRAKSESTNLRKYGTKHAAQSDIIKEKTKEHFQEKFGVDWPVQADWFQEKSKQTCLDRYGVEFTAQIPGRTEKMQRTNIERYGGLAPICSAEVRKKSIPAYKNNASSLERRLHNFLNEYEIAYESEYVIAGESFTHSFDVYLPEYKILIDCDGMFYHGYLDDPDGQWVLPDNDSRRLELIPEGVRFLIIVEDDFERGLKQLQRMVAQDSNILDYESDIFKWCRSTGFPYPEYTESRLDKDFSKLCNLDVSKLPRGNWFGLSSIRQYHRSIWDCRVKGNVSPKEAWMDDTLLKKVIANRLIYVDNLNPSNVLRGFNVSKIGPRVSIFNPVVAKYLIQKYLDNFSEVFDPFSGFSGRMLGACALQKFYIGQDIRAETVEESKQIIQKFDLTATVTAKDVLDSSGKYECLFTCPPYDDVELYQDGSDSKSCDEWIAECLARFDCQSYLFVVNETKQYENYIVEELPSRSHFRKSSEYIIFIESTDLKQPLI